MDGEMIVRMGERLETLSLLCPALGRCLADQLRLFDRCHTYGECESVNSARNGGTTVKEEELRGKESHRGERQVRIGALEGKLA